MDKEDADCPNGGVFWIAALLGGSVILTIISRLMHQSHVVILNPGSGYVLADHLLHTLEAVDSERFCNLPGIDLRVPTASPLPLQKIHFLISSCTKSFHVAEEYIGRWSTNVGSALVSPNNPVKYTIFLSPDDMVKTARPTQVINVTDWRVKWALMPSEALKTDNDSDWFVAMDDDTLPFIDRIAAWLPTLPKPRENAVYYHSPGERRSGTHYGNGGGSFILSRLLVEHGAELYPVCVRPKRWWTMRMGDVRLDFCSRKLTEPTYERSLYHIDPKTLTGNTAGFVEGLLSKTGVLSLHHLEKDVFWPWPPMRRFQLMRMFVAGGRILGDRQFRRSAVNRDGVWWILTEGFSLVKLPAAWTAARATAYLFGCEHTWQNGDFSFEIKGFLDPPVPDIHRLLLTALSVRDGVVREVYGTGRDAVVVERSGDEVRWNASRGS